MRLQPFKYSLLKYCPSQLLGEQVNVGILFFFEAEQKFEFLYPRALGRLKNLFPDADLSNLKHYLETIKHKINQLPEQQGASQDIYQLTRDGLFVADSNSFFFEAVQSSQYRSIPQIIDNYTSQYFSSYHPPQKESRHSDKYLLRSFSSKIKAQAHRFAQLALRDVSVVNKNGISAKFDYAWQNGQTNLVKPLSFDLYRKNSIQEKSVKWFGYVSQLEKKALESGFVFNFLIAKPSNIELLGSFDKAISILQEKQRLVKLIYEDSFDAYIQQAEESIQSFEGKEQL